VITPVTATMKRVKRVKRVSTVKGEWCDHTCDSDNLIRTLTSFDDHKLLLR
jgi:hypothetical protein